MVGSSPEVTDGGQRELGIPVGEWKSKSGREKLDLKASYGRGLHITDPEHAWPLDDPKKRYTPPEWLEPLPEPENLIQRKLDTFQRFFITHILQKIILKT